MKSIACSRVPAMSDRSRRDDPIEPNRGNRFQRLAQVRSLHALSRLIMAAALPFFAGMATIAQETTGLAPAAAGGAGLIETRAPQRLSQQPGGGVGGMGQAGVYSDRLQSIVSRAAPGRNPSKALVVLTSGPDAKTQGSLQEDLAVMSHILDKAMDDSLGSDQRLPKAMGVDLFFWPDAGSLRQAYLEGYGALFLLKVSFPLLPPPTKGEAQKEEPKGSSAWEEAREEVFGEPAVVGMGPGAAEDPYKEEKVNRLKSSLLDALKNAANIRDLKADEGVTVCVLGGAKQQPGRAKAIGRASGARPGEMTLLGGPREGTPQRGTILSIRVKKSAIDAFAKGQMDLDEFRQKALSTIYEGDVGTVPGFAGYGVNGFGGSYGGTAR
jgi:hypothetical protein